MDSDEASPPVLPPAAELIEQVELLDAIQHFQNQNQTLHQGSEETMSATNQTSSTSPPVSSQASLSPATASNQASSSASLTLGQAAAVISSGTTGTGNTASLVSGNNGQVIPNPTITYSQAGSSVSLAPGQATAATSSGTTGTGNVTAPAGGNNGQVSFNIGRSGLGLTLSPSLMHNNRRHTEVDYRCGICTGDILVKEKAAVRKASPLIFSIPLKLYS